MKNIGIFAIIATMFIGCATKTEYIDTYVPVKCNVDIPQLPANMNYVEYDARNLVIYTKKLYCNLSFCVNGEFPKDCVSE